MLFRLFYQRMTDTMWSSVGRECVPYISSPQVLLQTIVRGTDKVRYQVCWQDAQQKFPELLSNEYSNSDITPVYIRAIQGHSGKTKVDINKMSAWEVTEKHTWILFHAGWRHNMDSILRNGLLAGGATEKPGRRQHCYFSLRDPRDAASGDPSSKRRHDATDIVSGITTLAYPIHDSRLDAFYQIDLKRARELGLHFYQTPSCAVLCDENVPPECVLKITDMQGQVLYRNEHLLECAPGDRPAYMTVGTALSNTALHFDITKCGATWGTLSLIAGKSERDELFMKQYCCIFHNERICTRCHTFNFRGLVHCVKCGAVEQRELSRARGTFVTVKDQIEFTNAELRTLVYKMNYNYRGKLTDKDAILRARARKHLKRAKKGTLQLDGTYRSFNSVVERWDNDERYRTQLIDEEGLTREDVAQYDYLASLPTEEVKMDWEERKSRMRNHQWDVVQSRGGGRQTIKTSLYPAYAAAVEAKASQPASSSSSWQQTWWTQPSQEQRWQGQDWWQTKW